MNAAVRALGRDARVEHHLQQHVAEFLAEGLLIPGLERLERLVGLLEQVRGERRMGLPGVPGTLHAQPVHGRHQVEEPGPGQISRAVQQLSTRRERRLSTRLGQPHHDTVDREQLDVGIVHDPVPDPGLVQRGQLRMTGRNEHGGSRPQGLPGRPAEQPGRHPRAGHQDDQQAGVSPAVGVGFAGPGDAATGLGAETTWYWV